jgi:BarA-like signal transduction histidine kinase
LHYKLPAASAEFTRISDASLQHRNKLLEMVHTATVKAVKMSSDSIESRPLHKAAKYRKELSVTPSRHNCLMLRGGAPPFRARIVLRACEIASFLIKQIDLPCNKLDALAT